MDEDALTPTTRTSAEGDQQAVANSSYPRGMNPWLRVLVALVAVVVAAVLLRVLPPLVVLVGMVGGLVYANHRFKPTSARKRRSVAGTQDLGLTRSTSDPFGLVGYPFSLFGRGTGGRVADVLWGHWRTHEVKSFDFSYEASAEEGASVSRRFSCALVPGPAECPRLSVEPKAFLTPTGERGALREVVLGEGVFDEGFEVRSDDDAFARALLDPGLRGWLLEAGEAWGFEVSGRLALAYRPVNEPAEPAKASAVLEALAGFLARFPPPVLENYPLPPAAVPTRPDFGVDM